MRWTVLPTKAATRWPSRVSISITNSVYWKLCCASSARTIRYWRLGFPVWARLAMIDSFAKTTETHVVRCNGHMLGFPLIFVQFSVVMRTIHDGDDSGRSEKLTCLAALLYFRRPQWTYEEG